MAASLHNVRENLLLALDTLRGHKFRSLLTILGVLIGTTTVIAVASIITGLDTQLSEAVKDFGARSIYIYKFQPGIRFRLTREERMRKPLTYEDGMAIRELCPAVENVALEIWQWGPNPDIRYQDKEMFNGNFGGATPDDFQIINASLADGRLFNEIDNLHRRNVAVIGADMVTYFFQNQDPIGKTLLIDGNPFQVIGTLDKRKEFLGNTGNDRVVYIPYNTYRKFYPSAKENFLIALALPGKMDPAIDEITGVLRRRRHVKPSEPDSFGVATADSIITQFHQITGTVALVMVVLSSIGLLVGGIGVMNIMLISVTERTQEIGVRKAVGARRRDVRLQFLLEAVVLTLVGGTIGILIGAGVSATVRALVPAIPATLSYLWVTIGFAISVGVGLFFGYYPANLAANLDPISCLRYE